MKIADLKDKLPCRVKITSGYTLEESIDPGFVVDIVQIKPEEAYNGEMCYRFWFNIPPELIPICTKVAISDWSDNNRNHTWNYFEANQRLNKNGTFQSDGYVMENDDWFEFYEEPKSNELTIEQFQKEEQFTIPMAGLFKISQELKDLGFIEGDYDSNGWSVDFWHYFIHPELGKWMLTGSLWGYDDTFTFNKCEDE